MFGHLGPTYECNPSIAKVTFFVLRELGLGVKEYIPDKTIWEAFYGDGKSGKYLEELGFKVIHEKINFFDNNSIKLVYDKLVKTRENIINTNQDTSHHNVIRLNITLQLIESILDNYEQLLLDFKNDLKKFINHFKLNSCDNVSTSPYISAARIAFGLIPKNM